MNNLSLLKLLCVSTALLASTSINASLIDRGNGLIYDDDLDITWMENAYYAGTGMSRNAAQTYVDDLSFGGYDDWRLPTMHNVDVGVDVKDHTYGLYLTINPTDHENYTGVFGGELGHLVFGEGLNYVKTPGAGQFGTMGLFDNVFGGGYWSSEDYLWSGQSYEDEEGTLATDEKPYPRTPREGFGWLYYLADGSKTKGSYKTILHTGSSRGVWAVRDGDITTSPVPLPAAAWLYSIGLLGLTVARRKAG